MTELDRELPPKFDLRAVIERGIPFDRICLCAEERHFDLIRGSLEEGKKDPRGYGQLAIWISFFSSYKRHCVTYVTKHQGS